MGTGVGGGGGLVGGGGGVAVDGGGGGFVGGGGSVAVGWTGGGVSAGRGVGVAVPAGDVRVAAGAVGDEVAETWPVGLGAVVRVGDAVLVGDGVGPGVPVLMTVGEAGMGVAVAESSGVGDSGTVGVSDWPGVALARGPAGVGCVVRVG